MITKTRQRIGSSPRRIWTSALALGLVLVTSLIPATAQPALALNVAIATRRFASVNLVERTCLLRAEQTLIARGFHVWDNANDGHRTVQGRRDDAEVLVACVKEGNSTWGFVNVYAGDLDSAGRLADAVKGKVMGYAGSELID